jgi:DMSO reductase anchor subunit
MNKTGKFVTIFLWVTVIISAVLIVSMMVNISENEADATMGSWINSNLIWAYILVVLGVGVAVISGLLHMISDLSAAKRGLISLAFLGVIALISYLLASDEIPQFLGVDKFINDGTLNARVSKMVDTGLYATYFLLAIAILSIAFSSVTRIFNK